MPFRHYFTCWQSGFHRTDEESYYKLLPRFPGILDLILRWIGKIQSNCSKVTLGKRCSRDNLGRTLSTWLPGASWWSMHTAQHSTLVTGNSVLGFNIIRIKPISLIPHRCRSRWATSSPRPITEVSSAHITVSARTSQGSLLILCRKRRRPITDPWGTRNWNSTSPLSGYC